MLFLRGTSHSIPQTPRFGSGTKCSVVRGLWNAVPETRSSFHFEPLTVSLRGWESTPTAYCSIPADPGIVKDGLWKLIVVVAPNNFQEAITASSCPPCFCFARYTCEELEGLKVDNIEPQKIFSSSPLATITHKNNIYVVPMELDEKAAKLHVPTEGPITSSSISYIDRLKAFNTSFLCVLARPRTHMVFCPRARA